MPSQDASNEWKHAQQALQLSPRRAYRRRVEPTAAIRQSATERAGKAASGSRRVTEAAVEGSLGSPNRKERMAGKRIRTNPTLVMAQHPEIRIESRMP